MRYFFIYVLQLAFIAGYAQSGHFFLTNHSPTDKGIDHVPFDMIQDQNGVLNFATRSGVLTYDGKNWDRINCGGAVYALEITSTGEIFWSGTKGFGRIKRENSGKMVSKLLSDSAYQDVFQALTIGDKVYFMNEDGIVVLDGKTQLNVMFGKDLKGSFTLLFEMFNVPFVVNEQGQIFEIAQLKLNAKNFDLPGAIIFSCKAKDRYLIGTADNRLFLYNKDLSKDEIEIKERNYLDASIILNGAWVSDHSIVLGTLRGGAIFLNIENGSIEEIINYSTGLPDNEVLSLLVDKNNSVWVGHNYGFTCVAPFLPFRSFSRYDNLKGNLLCATSLNDEVYVGTSLGLYKLNREETYDEMIYYEDVPVKRKLSPGENQVQENKKSSVSQTLQSNASNSSTEGEKKKGNGFLKFLRRKRNKVAENSNETIHEGIVAKQPLTKNDQLPKQEVVIQRLKKIEKVLRSAQFKYEKVDGIEAKVNNLATANGKLVAGGIDGLFEVDGLGAKSIIDKPVRYFFMVNDTFLIMSTYDDRVHALVKDKAEWELKDELIDIEDQISFAFQHDEGDLWLCGVQNIYRVRKNGNSLVVTEPAFQNQNFSRTVGFYLHDKPVFVNANGFYDFQLEKNRIVKIDTLAAPGAYFASPKTVWHNDGHSWNVFAESIPGRAFHMLSLCDDIRFIAQDEHSDNLWVINRDNELYKVFGDGRVSSSNSFKLFFKSISQNGNTLKGKNRLVVNQENGSLDLEVAQANFVGGPPLEYRYLLKGIDNSWSEWSSRNDHISFTYLPLGNYTLRVQSRDVFGSTSEMDPLQFLVQPPYWKTPWFYAMEFTIFALLVLLSFKLSVRYRFISRVLSLLTIILLIEFIQTIIGITFFTNSSPIIDFLIQVIVALIILPVEGFLRNLMFKSMGANSKLFEVIAELDRQQKNKK